MDDVKLPHGVDLDKVSHITGHTHQKILVFLRLFNGSAKDLVAALVHSDGLTRDDIEELRSMFQVEE